MKAEKDDECRCPRCDDRIPEQFYCRGCGYVPDWGQIEVYKTHRDAELKNHPLMSYLDPPNWPPVSTRRSLTEDPLKESASAWAKSS